MWRKLLVVILTLLVLGCVGMVVYIALYPDRAHQYAQVAAHGRSTDEYDRLVRRPPPKPTPEPGTPTPIPTPESTRIARRSRVKPDDFPFGLNNQVVQPDSQIRVTIDIRNRSGREWPTAYLVLSSAYHPEKSHYRIDNWRVGETRSVDYVFPAAEVCERLAEL